MVLGTVYTYPDRIDFRSAKLLITAKISGAELDQKFVHDKAAKDAVGVSHLEFIKKFPFGRIPGLEVKDSGLLEESNAAAYFLANDDLKGGSSEFVRADVLQWMNVAESEVVPAIYNLVFRRIGLMPPLDDPSSAENAVNKVLKCLDEHLALKTFFVNERLTLADICLSTALALLFERGYEPNELRPFRHLLRWFDTIINQKTVKEILGNFKYCQKIQSVSEGSWSLSLSSAKQKHRTLLSNQIKV